MGGIEGRILKAGSLRQQGYKYKQIAEVLGCTVSTAHLYVKKYNQNYGVQVPDHEEVQTSEWKILAGELETFISKHGLPYNCSKVLDYIKYLKSEGNLG